MPGGRPSKIDQVVKTLDDGTRVTAADAVVEAMRRGHYLETAARLAGVSKKTVYAWIKQGREASVKLEKAEGMSRAKARAAGLELTAADERHLAFLNAVEQASAEAEDRLLNLLDMHAQGGLVVRREKTKVVHRVVGEGEDAKLVELPTEVEVVEEQMLPNAQVIEWRLERRSPERWGRRRLEVTGGQDSEGEDLPVNVRISGMVERLRGLQQPPDDDEMDDERIEA